MRKISKIQAIALITGMICINSNAISKYIFPLTDFTNGILKGIGIVLIIFFIAQTQSKKKSPKTNQ